jgi:hypothetical protein
MPNVLIATPTPGDVKTGYVATIADTLIDLLTHNIGAAYLPAEGGDVIAQRNALAARLLVEPTFSHMFFVDGDMQFGRDLCRRLLAADKPLIGAVYSARKRNPDGSLTWYGFFEGAIEVRNGVAKARAVPLGACLIHRAVFETILANGLVTKRPPEPGCPDIFNFFGALDNHPTSDDHSICRRWTKCGGEIHALVDAEIFHIGHYRYGGRFIDTLTSLGPQAAAAPSPAASAADPPASD